MGRMSRTSTLFVALLFLAGNVKSAKGKDELATVFSDTAESLTREPQATDTPTRAKRSTTECRARVTQAFTDFYVFLTVNSVIKTNFLGLGADSRRIEMNWTPPPGGYKAGDWVGLFRKDAAGFSISDPIVRVNAANHDGYVKTSHRFPQYPMLGLNSRLATCLYGYWVGYVRNNRTLKANCLKLRPRWMWRERGAIGDTPLHALMIPGSHNAGAYKVTDEDSSYNIRHRYSVNQGEDVWSQLLYGIRYLDLRVGHYTNTPEKFWIVHDFVKMNPLYVVVQDVRKFLKETNEIVIMDLHRFPHGFEKTSRHLELVEYLEGELGEFMAPDWIWENVTPNDLWNMNRTLILSYAHDPSSAYNDKIWPEVQHAWGDKERASDLRQYLDDAMWRNRHAKYLWAAMTHLTPSTISAILNPSGGFAKLSDKIAKKVTKWYRDDWWNAANIVASDYVLGNNLVEESIRANRKRKKCRDER